MLSSFIVFAAQATNSEISTIKSPQVKSAEKSLRMQDFKRAFSLYQAAATNGDAEAQYQLSNMLTLGTGGRVDKNAARTWLGKASAQNHPAALYQMGMLIREENKQKAGELIQRSAQLGYRPALELIEGRGENFIHALEGDDENNSLWFGAARKNSPEELKRLVKEGQIIDQVDSAGRTALFAAIESKSTEAVDWLLANKANPNHRDKFGDTPAFAAARTGNKPVLKKILAAGGQVDHVLGNGDNLWHYIIRLQQPQMASILMQHKTPVNQQNIDGWTPLDMAEYKGDKSIIQLLKQKGATHGKGWTNTNTILSVTPETFFETKKGVREVSLAELAKVMFSGNVTLTQKIVDDQPALLNQIMPDGSHLLLLAVNAKNADMVNVFLQRKADVNQPGAGGITALHSAARQNDSAMIQVLLDAGADPLQMDDNQMDAIGWAIQSEHSESALLLLQYVKENRKLSKASRYLLLSAKANLADVAVSLSKETKLHAVSDDLGRSAIWYAAYNNNPELIKRLSRVVKTQSADNQGKTPFFVAVERNCYECAVLLFPANDVNLKTQSGDTPLIAAAATGNAKLVQWLISKGVDVELRNELGNTALIVATEHEDMNIVKLLVGEKAKPGRKNKLGISALDVAERKNQTIYAYLKEQSVLGVF